MLHINALTFRIEGRMLFDSATVALPAGQKIGFVGRNGTGKSTLLHIIMGELHAESGSVSVPRNARIGTVAQEAPGGDTSLLETVLAADLERARLMAAAETATDGIEIAEIQTRLADIDAHSAPARAATILSGLGFTRAQQDSACSLLSGGWRMRVALAAALFASPDVLLLDEPTNYLDLEGVIWLKNYLRNYRQTVLIVSHDRDLLNECVDAILHLDQCRLALFAGNYDNFERQRRERQALQMKLRKKQEDSRRHMEAFVDRFRYKASKARQAQSRLKALEKMEPIADVVADQLVAFHFPDPEKPLNPPLVRLEKAATGYDGTPVLRNLDLRIDGDDRIALLGANGNGKSTFAKLLCGRLALLDGHMRHHKRLEVAYFAQHQLDELSEDQTPYDVFCRLMPDATQAQRRARLGAYGFGINHADTKTGKLSGGEKARLLFAQAAFGGPHILVLDEPTNHLDVNAREALIHAINNYQGAVILISHDRHLIETCVDRLWIVNDGTVKPYDDDLDGYAKLVLEQARAARRTGPKAARQAQKTGKKQKAVRQNSQTDSARGPRNRKNLVPLRKKLQDCETSVAGLQEKLSVLDTALSDPTLYRDEPEKAGKFARLRVRLASDLEKAETAWLEAEDAVQNAMGQTRKGAA